MGLEFSGWEFQVSSFMFQVSCFMAQDSRFPIHDCRISYTLLFSVIRLRVLEVRGKTWKARCTGCRRAYVGELIHQKAPRSALMQGQMRGKRSGTVLSPFGDIFQTLKKGYEKNLAVCWYFHGCDRLCRQWPGKLHNNDL